MQAKSGSVISCVAWIQWADMQAKSSSVISCVCLDTVG